MFDKARFCVLGGAYRLFAGRISFPYEEHPLFYMLITVRNLLALASLQHYFLTTVFSPLVMAVTCRLFILVVVYRRR
jgi:hypothetical protein